MKNNLKMERFHTNVHEPKCSVKLPWSKQFCENQGWEEDIECQLLDSKSYNNDNFDEMPFDELVHLIRHMDNFLMERGISEYFMRNYAIVSHAFEEAGREACEKEALQ